MDKVVAQGFADRVECRKGLRAATAPTPLSGPNYSADSIFFGGGMSLERPTCSCCCSCSFHITLLVSEPKCPSKLIVTLGPETPPPRPAATLITRLLVFSSVTLQRRHLLSHPIISFLFLSFLVCTYIHTYILHMYSENSVESNINALFIPIQPHLLRSTQTNQYSSSLNGITLADHGFPIWLFTRSSLSTSVTSAKFRWSRQSY